MKIVDFVLQPGTLLLLCAASLVTAFVCFDELYLDDRIGTDGLVLGLFVFASAALVAAVVCRFHRRDGE